MAAGSLHLPSPPGNRSSFTAMDKGTLNHDSTWHHIKHLNTASSKSTYKLSSPYPFLSPATFHNKPAAPHLPTDKSLIPVLCLCTHACMPVCVHVHSSVCGHANTIYMSLSAHLPKEHRSTHASLSACHPNHLHSPPPPNFTTPAPYVSLCLHPHHAANLTGTASTGRAAFQEPF